MNRGALVRQTERIHQFEYHDPVVDGASPSFKGRDSVDHGQDFVLVEDHLEPELGQGGVELLEAAVERRGRAHVLVADHIGHGYLSAFGAGKPGADAPHDLREPFLLQDGDEVFHRDASLFG